jgi:hypothetical protein
MNERGLDPDGTIAREGALELVPAAFSPVVDAARAHIRTSDLTTSAGLFGHYYPERAPGAIARYLGCAPIGNRIGDSR